MSAVVAREIPQSKAVSVPAVQDLVVWFHETDQNLVFTLDPHLQMLIVRFSNRFQLHYFRTPTDLPLPPVETDDEYMHKRKEEALKKYQARYQGVLQSLSRAALFLPCISPAFLLQFWQDTASDPQLRAHLVPPAFPILPLLMHPMAGTASAALSRPLLAFADGYEREAACATIAERIAETLRRCYHLEDTNIQAPFLMLEAPRGKKRSIFSLHIRQK